MFNKPEEGGVWSSMGPGDWNLIGPSMHNFTSQKKAKLVFFHI
jgi:allophanate hydrolase subunit 1